MPTIHKQNKYIIQFKNNTKFKRKLKTKIIFFFLGTLKW